jgi:hypothetical protein
MGRKSGVSYKERLDAVEKYLRHECSIGDCQRRL